ncbi:hypothetical protein BDY19DRAFT_677620 [Irpex rosettiformis]|uniref:Uncharacterized protein n=1 Tax=Irpex rosettiformis TaxID=378272 RepID=A0ACB8UA11_9APHY|nr:hypothetical protein BDY19DRAFT_677620 [Irpex rosettiformis]
MPAPVTKTAALYETLNLQPDATDDEVRVAYKKLALKWHPDRCQDNKEEAQQKFVEIQAAYLKILEERERHQKHKPRKKTSAKTETSSAPSSTPSTSSTSSSTSGRANTERSSAGPSTPRQESVPLKEEKEKKSKDHKSRKPTAKTDHHAASSSSSDTSRPSSEYSSASTSTPRHESVPLKEEKEHKTSNQSERPDPPQQVGKKLKKRRPELSIHTPSNKPEHDSSDDEDVHLKKHHFAHRPGAALEDTDYEFVDLADLSSPLHPLRTPKSKPRGLGDNDKDPVESTDSDWVFPLPVALEDMYEGVSQHYRITRTLRSGSTQSVKIDVTVSPNWYDGKRIRVSGVGNERKDGTFQDIVFVVEVHPHPAFTREGDNLVASVQVPWADPHTRPYPPSDSKHGQSLVEEEDEVYLKALDGREYAVPIPRSLVEGADGTRIKGAGMPIRKHGKRIGKGDMIVKWEFIFSDAEKTRSRPSWQTFKRAIHRKR